MTHIYCRKKWYQHSMIFCCSHADFVRSQTDLLPLVNNPGRTHLASHVWKSCAWAQTEGPWGTSLEMYEITYYNNDTPHGLVQPGLIDLYDLCPPYGPMVSQAVAHPLLQSQNAPTLGKSASTFAGGFWSQYIYIYIFRLPTSYQL